MATQQAPIVIKKYANRRLYNTRTSTYVTLDDLAAMVREGDEFVVQDAKTGEDITRGVLGQIIFDAESRGSGLLPIAFLRQLITFYGGQMQTLVPTYLEHALATFAREQETFSREMNKTIGAQALSVVEDQVRRNMDMFERSMRMFMPYAGEGAAGSTAPSSDEQQAGGERRAEEEHLAKDVAALRTELASMQAKVEALSAVKTTDAGPVPPLPASPSRETPLPRAPLHKTPSAKTPIAADDGDDEGFMIGPLHGRKT